MRISEGMSMPISEEDVAKLIKRVNFLEDSIGQLRSSGIGAYSAYGSTDMLALRVVSQTPQLLDIYWQDNNPGAGSVSWSAGTLIYRGEVYDLFAGSSSSKFIYWQRSNPRLLQGSATFPALGDDDFLIATNVGGAHDLAWNNASAAKHITNLQVDSITADQVVGGVFSSTLYNLKIVIVEGMTLTNNSPGAGSIAWSGPIKVYYQGSTYNITAGNTSSPFVVWTPGTTTFTGVSSYGGSVYLIATNVGGTAQEAWDRGGTALGAIQEENLNFGLLAGLEMQPVSASVMTDPTVAGSSSPLLGSSNLITVNQACLLQTMSFYIVTPFTTSPPGGGTATSDMVLRLAITVDGGTTLYLNIIAETGSAVAQALEFTPDVLIWCPLGTGLGLVAKDKAAGIIGITAKTSLVVDLQMWIANGGGVPSTKTLYGSMRVGLGYAVKL